MQRVWSKSRLYGVSLAISLAIHALLCCLLIIFAKGFLGEKKPKRLVPRSKEIVVHVVNSVLKKEKKEPLPPSASKAFLRTRRQDEIDDSKKRVATFIGEHDTQAKSSANPVRGASSLLISQEGDKPLHSQHIETTQSLYQSGRVADGLAERGRVVERFPEPFLKEQHTEKSRDRVQKDKPSRNQSMELAKKVDRRTLSQQESRRQQQSLSPKKTSSKLMKKKRHMVSNSFEKFQGNQRKTRIVGSISRRGQSALDVQATPKGRYQAKIGRIIERQWLLQCERNRDHIVPGMLSLRFYVDTKGKVSGIAFEEAVGSNGIEKGFTQRAIRHSDLPAMPPELVREQRGAPIELIYNFYF